MAEAAKKGQEATAQAYYTTSYTFNTSTTSTATLMVWRQLARHLEVHQLPMSGEDLCRATGLTQKQIDDMFRQEYYQKYYGFRKFKSIDEWRQWSESTGVLYVPALHDPKPQAPDEEDDLVAEDIDAEEV